MPSEVKTAIEVRVCPPETKCGTTGFVSYQNPHFQEAMRACFGVRDYEELIGVDFMPDGVHAYFKYRK